VNVHDIVALFAAEWSVPWKIYRPYELRHANCLCWCSEVINVTLWMVDTVNDEINTTDCP
jgi:hypothetical protein